MAVFLKKGFRRQRRPCHRFAWGFAFATRMTKWSSRFEFAAAKCRGKRLECLPLFRKDVRSHGTTSIKKTKNCYFWKQTKNCVPCKLWVSKSFVFPGIRFPKFNSPMAQKLIILINESVSPPKSLLASFLVPHCIISTPFSSRESKKSKS